MSYSLLRHDTVQFGTNVWRNLFCTKPVNSRSPDVTIRTTHHKLQAYLFLFMLYLCILWEKSIFRNWPSDWNLYRWRGMDCRTYPTARGSNITLFTLSPQCLMYKYWYSMSTKISTKPTTCTGKLFCITVTSVTSDAFPNASWKLDLSALPNTKSPRKSIKTYCWQCEQVH